MTRRINEVDMVGVNLNDDQQYLDQSTGWISEYHYDEPRYDTFWAAVEKLDVLVHLRPRAPLSDDIQRLYATRPWLLGPTYSFIRDTSFHTLAICIGGVFDHFPGVKTCERPFWYVVRILAHEGANMQQGREYWLISVVSITGWKSPIVGLGLRSERLFGSIWRRTSSSHLQDIFPRPCCSMQ